MRVALVSVVKRRSVGRLSISRRGHRSAGTHTRSPVAAAMAARSSSACTAGLGLSAPPKQQPSTLRRAHGLFATHQLTTCCCYCHKEVPSMHNMLMLLIITLRAQSSRDAHGEKARPLS